MRAHRGCPILLLRKCPTFHIWAGEAWSCDLWYLRISIAYWICKETTIAHGRASPVFGRTNGEPMTKELCCSRSVTRCRFKICCGPYHVVDRFENHTWRQGQQRTSAQSEMKLTLLGACPVVMGQAPTLFAPQGQLEGLRMPTDLRRKKVGPLHRWALYRTSHSRSATSGAGGRRPPFQELTETGPDRRNYGKTQVYSRHYRKQW